ncbi:glyoxylate/hydroxypyruvate reductase A [Pseudooceanicola antarcticus]|uniref:Glyoxylate/hydroxypyruvate reductase A n=1 Tax=Pseudooceanicola antarcticus TaxID=1247613 RepID=A0A285J7H6_9RHOB|nr:glyoxylate/hydroxypyruvate reductase A [Pseudooceanicola antarcticus]PJE27019.1 glyoxylate/hydroxypyruvate reductase A [Pseudooceanicola antarcticus]SNY56172.1 glyoxylate/hydroxypyruvate reductase A [Pseudooceanicola antarcticus]
MSARRHVNVLFSAPKATYEEFHPAICAALQAAGVPARVAGDLAPEEVDYIVFTPNDLISDFSVFPRARAALSIWAGVDKVLHNPTLTMPLARMVDPGQREGMVEFVTAHVLRHHIGMDRHILSSSGWDQVAPKLARHRKVTMLGLGELGGACAQALSALNFYVHGWSRRPRALEGITCHAGPDGLEAALAGAEIIICLLPTTPETENVLNAHTLSLPAAGAVVINPGRGALIDDAALIAALDSGALGHATLDTFRVEPLPEDHPFRAHPKVTVSPHVASLVRVDTSAAVIAENIRRGEAGEAFLHLVNRQAGY